MSLFGLDLMECHKLVHTTAESIKNIPGSQRNVATAIDDASEMGRNS